MGQRAPRLSLWLVAAALVVSAHASAINLNRNTYKGCISQCNSKNNYLHQDSRSGLSALWGRNSATQGDQSALQFELGQTYTYRVRTSNEVRTVYPLDEAQNSVEQLINVQATAWITPISECELSMQLRDVKVSLKDESQAIGSQADAQEFIRQLETPILFGYTNGAVFEVCTSVDESNDEAVNIKKSIISALQTTSQLENTEITKVLESDVNGECETEYTVEKQSRGKYTITKEKDLSECANVEQPQLPVNWQHTLLRHNTDSTAACIQTVQSRRIQSAQCESVRTLNTVLSHFSVQLVSNVEIDAVDVFAATEEQSAQVPEQWSRHSHRLMMSMPGVFGMKKEAKEAKRYSQLVDGRVQLKTVLDQICDNIQTHGKRVTTKTATYVQILADTLKRSSQEDVQFVWKNIIQGGHICSDQAKKIKDIFVDTAASVMDRNCAAIVRDELFQYIERAQQDESALKRARYLATVVAFSFEPTAEAVRDFLPELLEKIEDEHIILSLSALLPKVKYQMNGEAQFLESLYQTVLQKITHRLNKENVWEIEADIIRLFTALENIDPRTAISNQNRLVSIITNKRLPVSIRSAAIKSFGHIEMVPEVRRTLFTIFADRSETNEVRLTAYRTLVESQVTVEELHQIRKVIETEDKQDVHNYVCSHQKNLRTSDNLRKRALLPLEAPLFPEPQSVANFLVSRNFEYSSINEKTQIGAFVEADIVMEEQSRVPRLVAFNLTVPVAEQQIPIVQLTIRQQGLEQSLIDRLESIKQIRSPAHALRELSAMVRSAKRASQQKKSHQHQHQSPQYKDGQLQIFINVDGKHVYVWDSVECAQEHSIDQFESVIAQLYKRLPIQIDETMVMMPLKHRVRLPTASGIPVNFELNTTLIASLESTITGHAGVESLLEAHIKPTFVVELGVGLEADLHFQGQPDQRIAFINRFTTSPTFHVKASIKPETRQLRVKVLMPENEQIIGRFETEYNNQQNEQTVLQALKPSLQQQVRKAMKSQKKRVSSFSKRAFYRVGDQSAEECLPVLDQLFGFTYCIQHFTDADLKQSLSTRSGQKSIFLSQIKLVKTDRQMEGIEFGLQLPELFTPEATADEFKFLFHFDTPNSQVNRRVNTELVVRIPQSAEEQFVVRLDIDSPLKKFAGQMVLLNQENAKGLKIELVTDRAQRQFLLEANAIVKVEDRSRQQIKLQLRLQPSATARLTEVEGEYVYAVQSENKKKVTLKLKANEKEIFEMDFTKAGSFRQPIDCKASLAFQIDLLGAQIQYSSLFNKNQKTGTLKSTGELKYNHFLAYSRRNRDTTDTIAYQFQFSGLNKEANKKFVHWSLQSSQFPQLKQELTYNVQGTWPEDRSEELNFKWSTEQERRVRFVHQTKQLQNVRTRSLKHQSSFELEITPLNFHHDARIVLDLPYGQQAKAPKFGAELKSQNRKTGEITVEAQFAYAVVSESPLKIEAQGEMKLRNGRYIYQYRDVMEEVHHNEFQGHSVIEVPQEMIFPGPKKVQHKYTIKVRDSPARRFPEGENRYWNMLARLANSIEKVDQEIIIEDPTYGQIHQIGQLVCTGDDVCSWKWQLERDGRMLCKIESEVNRREMTYKGKVETAYLDQLTIQMDSQLHQQMKRCELKVANRRFAHESRIIADKREKKYELSSQTKKAEQIVFELDAKKVGKTAQMVVKSELIDAEIELENVHPIPLIQSMLKKRSIYENQEEDSQVKIAFKVPQFALEHQSEIKLQPAQRQLTIASNTRKEERNLFKFQLHLQPEEKTFVAEYLNGYIANVKLTKDGSERDWHLVADYRIEPKQWFHKTNAKWHFDRHTRSTFAPFQFRLISLEMKNHLGQKNVFDFTYRCNEQNPSAEYAHDYILSTRDSHAELHLSRFGFDYANSQYQPKALFSLKTKAFGGVEHKTELKQINLEKRQLKVYSKTARRDEVIAQVECDLAWQRGQQSHIKVQLANGHQIDVQFVPFEWFEVQANYRGYWQYQARFDRKANNKQWNLKVESIDERKNEQWKGQLAHQCDQYTTLELDTPYVRGNIEVRLDAKKIRIDLKGDKKWSGLEQKLEAQLNTEAKKVAIKSVTSKHSKPMAFVDAEIYGNMHRTSTLKVELEPVNFKLHIQADPKAAAEVTVEAKQWKHSMQIKKRSAANLMIQSETRKNGEMVAQLETELSPAKVQFKWELAQPVKRLSPISVKGKIDLEDKEMHLTAHHQRSNRAIKFEAKAKDLNNVHVECAWDAKRDQTKKAAIQVRIQDKQSAPERFVADVRGELIHRPFNVQIDVPRQLNDLYHANVHVEGELKNRQTGEQFVAKYHRKAQNEQTESQFEVRKNEFTYIKTTCKANIEHSNQKTISFKVESDLKIDALNAQMEISRECSYKQCQTKAVAKYGAEEKREIKFEGANVADALRGQLTIHTPSMHQQTIKFEFIKPESKLQINVYNQAGRQLDVNVDLARPLQKKFQIVSFIESIPTVDIEAAHGENSRLVIQVSFQEEKKMELAINWFGQWRRDFKLEALFKCFSRPAIEMLITSRHPAGVDEIDAMLKLASQEYVAKWSRTFDESKQNWNTNTLVKVNGEKKVDLKVTCQTKEQSNRIVKSFSAQLDGVRHATGHVTVHLRKAASHPLKAVEMIQCEFGNERTPRQVSFELYAAAQDEQQSTSRSGFKLAAQDKTIFGLVHMTNKRQHAANKDTSMIRLELPDEIEYVLRNELEYDQYEIKSIRSELKKKQNSVQPIYQTVISFHEDQATDMKVMRIEVHSSRFTAPKVIQVRYNFQPKQCHELEPINQWSQNQNQNEKRSYAYGATKCWRVEVLAGSAQQNGQFQGQQQHHQYESEQQFNIKFGAEYLKHPIDSRHYNRTVRFILQAQPQEQSQQQRSINFQLTGHVSHRSVGMHWENENRFGEQKHGMFYLDLQPLDSSRSMVNMYLRKQNKNRPAKDFTAEVHFSPQQIRKTMNIAAKWDQESLRRWVVGELPQLEEMAREQNLKQVRSKMMREIKAEIAHKMEYLKENYHNELVAPIMEEAKAVQEQMKASEDQIAREVAKAAKKAAEKAEELYESIDLEQSVEELVENIAQTMKQAKRQAGAYVAAKCQKNAACRKVVDQIRDYEIEQFLEENVYKKAQQMKRSLKKAVPEELLESMKQLVQEFAAAHDDGNWLQEEREEYEQYKKNHPRHFIKHGARLLKMAQPEMTETMMKHYNKISKRFENEDSLNQGNQQEQQIDWPEVRGAVHDMAVDLIDVAQKKSQQPVGEEKPFWSQFYSGASGSGNGQQNDYSQYSNQWKQWGKKANKSQKQYEMEDQEEGKNNFLFSPKRGEFKLIGAQSTAATSTYWGRT